MAAPHWYVLGAGAIGCLYAHALQRSGCQTTLVMRTGTQQRVIPLIVERSDARSEISLPAITADDPETITQLLVTTKAYDVHSAVAGIAHLLVPGSVLLLLVNGMGLAEQLAAEWPHLDIYCGTSTEGAYRVAAQHIRHAGRGETRIGRQGQAEPAPWFGQWAGAIEPCIWDRQIVTAQWAKLSVNCIINPLTAIRGCVNGALAARPELVARVATLCDEVASISAAAGYTDVAASLAQTVASVIAGTANNRSSMLQDILHGRRTEIDYITGYLLQVAEQYNIPAPHNRALFEAIKKRVH